MYECIIIITALHYTSDRFPYAIYIFACVIGRFVSINALYYTKDTKNVSASAVDLRSNILLMKPNKNQIIFAHFNNCYIIVYL